MAKANVSNCAELGNELSWTATEQEKNRPDVMEHSNYVLFIPYNVGTAGRGRSNKLWYMYNSLVGSKGR